MGTSNPYKGVILSEPRVPQANKAWSAYELEKLTVVQLVKEFSVYYRIRGLFTEFTTAYDSSLP
jgi:hypothetical protein